MPFDAFDVAVDLVRSLREPVARIAQADASLAGQIRRAAASTPLNLRCTARLLRRDAPSARLRLAPRSRYSRLRSLASREGRRRAGRDRQHQWRVAAGRADEVVACLRVAEAWGCIDAAAIAERPVALPEPPGR